MTCRDSGAFHAGLPMNFLIVEDNENMRRTISSIISALAGEMHECSDGSEALAAYAAHLPDWVLMDVKMKEMDGITATRQIKNVFPKANIMIVSDYDDPDLRIAARQAGASEYVIKENLFDVYHILCQHAGAGDVVLCEEVAR
jgi:DNA-binding NarL/FixJ family response regulator